MASILKVDKLDPQSGTDLEIGSSGDTITIPSGATFTQSGTMNASAITAGTVATARLGSGTASSSTVLYGDQTYKAEPSGGKVLQTKFSQAASSVSISNSGAAVDIATLSFTPISSTSQMMITICGVFYKQNNNTANSKFNVLRDSTQCDQENWSSAVGSYLFYSGGNATEHIGPLTYVVFDKPLSTTTVTYKFQASNTGTNTVSFYSGAKIIVTEVEA